MPIYLGNTEIEVQYVDSYELGNIYLGANKTQAGGETYIQATGGTITTSGNFKIHTFTTTGSSTFTINSLGNNSISNTIEFLVIGGGGGGGAQRFDIGPSIPTGGGGGAGGVARTGSLTVTSSGTFSVTVGDGGAGATFSSVGGFGFQGIEAESGISSSFLNISASGGNGGVAPSGGGANRGNGGSNADFTGGAAGGVQIRSGGGGAGAGQNGQSAISDNEPGDGGNGFLSSITLVSTYYGGGGGAVTTGDANFGTGGNGGGGNGYATGSANTGGGGGGNAGDGGTGFKGGSGVVIVRYPYK